MKELGDLYGLAEENNISVDCFELRKRESLSIMEPDGQCYIAIDPGKIKDERDERSKLAHELGHCLTGSFYNQYAAIDSRQRHENKADKWAAQNLVTEDQLDEAVASGHTEIWDLADVFGLDISLMRKVVCWYTYGNVAADLYF